ncbi:hypothetical protein [Klenkia marina]|uniref:hypothetical protein n=1 Tax=Klenkia marina TaxID=1960309 RepID=UPI00105A697C|nr:hypothetical protein [Klenkia marina]
MQFVLEEHQVGRGVRAASQPDPRLGDVGVGVEAAPGRTVSPPVAEVVLVEHQVLLDLGDVGLGEGSGAIRAQGVRQAGGDGRDVRGVGPERVVLGVGPAEGSCVVHRSHRRAGGDGLR